MIFTLCATCNRVIFSWETPSMLEGLPPAVEWTHYVRCDIADPESGKHDAVPVRFLTDWTLDKA